MTPTNYAQLYYSSDSWTTRQTRSHCRATAGTGIPGADAYQACGQHPRGADRWRPERMIGYKQLKLNEESLESGLTLLEAVYQSTQNQAANGLATQSQVLSARQQLESTQATKLTLTSSEQKLRQTLCTMLGWKYDAKPEIKDVPAADLTRIDGMNPEKDKQAAQDNNLRSDTTCWISTTRTQAPSSTRTYSARSSRRRKKSRPPS